MNGTDKDSGNSAKNWAIAILSLALAASIIYSVFVRRAPVSKISTSGIEFAQSQATAPPPESTIPPAKDVSPKQHKDPTEQGSKPKGSPAPGTQSAAVVVTPAAPPTTQPAASAGTVVQGPCSVFQNGGSGNTATGGNCGSPQRHLTDDEKRKLAAMVHATRILPIMCHFSDSEGCAYAAEFRAAFKAAGMEVEPGIGFYGDAPIDSEVYLARPGTLADLNNPPDEFVAVMKVLSDAGINAKTVLVTNGQRPIELWIGRH